MASKNEASAAREMNWVNTRLTIFRVFVHTRLNEASDIEGMFPRFQSRPGEISVHDRSSSASGRNASSQHDGSRRAHDSDMPFVIAQIITLAQSHADVDVIADVMRRSPELSARVLRHGRSPIFSRGAQAETIEEAVLRLGCSEVVRLATSLAA
jgi:hypothetical protein